MRVAALLATAPLLIAACASSPSPIQTGKSRYAYGDGSFGPEVVISARFRAPEGSDVRIANCNGAIAWGLQREVEGQWVDAWVNAMDACMSAPIHVPAGGVHSYEHLIRARAGAVLHPRKSADAVVEPGTYRIVWHGVDLPLEQRVSNEFGIDDARRAGMLGEDGHTASLFPGTSVLDVGDHIAAAVYQPAVLRFVGIRRGRDRPRSTGFLTAPG